MLSQSTTFLAKHLCGGSSRKLIAGWWYSILGMTAMLAFLSFLIVGGNRRWSESFCALWSAMMLCILSVGGTMIMRKFHNSMAVGFFMGSVVSMSQMFFLLFLLYISFGRDQAQASESFKEESWIGMVSLIQSILLGSFAGILAAHRSEILDKPGNAVMDMIDELHGIEPSPSMASGTSNNNNQKTKDEGDYNPPARV